MQITLIVIAGLTIIILLMMYLLLRRSVREEVARLREELTLALPGGKHAPGAGGSHFVDKFQHEARDHDPHELTPEALSEVAATLSAFLGKDVRISAVAEGPLPNEANHLWAQQGHLAIQNSHDLPRVKLAAPRPLGSVRRPPRSERRNVA